MNDKICMYTAPFGNMKSFFEMVDVAVEYGIKNIETINAFEFLKPDIEFAKKLREYADKKGVKFTCSSVGINLVGDNNRDAIERVKDYALVAKELGSPLLHHTIALECGNPDIIRQNRDTYFERGILAVREITDFAAELGIQTVYEDQGYLFNGVEGFKAFLSEVDRDIKLVADFGNILFADEKIEGFIAEFKDKIANVHIKDYTFTTEKREKNYNEFYSYNRNIIKDCMLGEGAVDFEAAFSLLKEIGYDGYYALESPPMGDNHRESFEKNLAYLEKLIY